MTLDQLAARLEAAERQLVVVERRTSNIPARWPGATGGGGAVDLIYTAAAAEAIMYGQFGDVTTTHSPTAQTIEVYSGIYEVPKDVPLTIGFDQAQARWQVIAAPTWYPLWGPEELAKGTQSYFRIHGSDHLVRAKYGTLRAGRFWGLQWTYDQSGASAAGPRYAGTVVDDASVGATAWSNPGNATTDNGSEATNAGDSSHYLKATNPAFTFDPSLIITGIGVDVKRRQLGTAQYIDQSIRLVKAGVISGDDKATVTPWNSLAGYVSYGGVGQLWGLPWTAADLNLASFGVAIAGKSDGPGTVNARIDAIRFKVFFNTVADDLGGPCWLGTELEC